MARKKEHPLDAFDENAPDAAKRTPLDRTTRKMVNLLKEIGGCYRDAASALAVGDDNAAESSFGLAESYRELYAKLARMTSDAITAEGLAQSDES